MKWSDFMKTKSKRFLNLATLCLALLGTTLLMTCPVKAEVSKSEGAERTEQQNLSRDRQEGVEEGDDEAGSDTSKKDREFGKQEGFEAGKKGYWPNVNREEIPILRRIDFEDKYREGYQEGYSEGWHQEHPLLGVVFDVFDSIWNVMSGLFNGVN
ncbi:TPA: hypothetical protein VB373_000684 [Streptococcus pyogenes]|nr:hypothetical protein [Streptococcus pyogenes]HER0922638.1 hypothetical protein [Streptococcus pyogenes]